MTSQTTIGDSAPGVTTPQTTYDKSRCALQGVGAWSALLFSLVLASTIALSVMAPSLGVDEEMPHQPARFIAFITQHYEIFRTISLVQVLSCALLFPMIRVMEDCLRGRSPMFTPLASAFGYVGAALYALTYLSNSSLVGQIPTHAASVVGQQQWANHLMLGVSASGYGLFIGLWTLMISWIGLRHGGLSRLVCYSGLVVGILDVLMLLDIPFGLALSVFWFPLVAIFIFRLPASSDA